MILLYRYLDFLLSAAEFESDGFFSGLPSYQIDRIPGSGMYHWYCRRQPSTEGFVFKRRLAKIMGAMSCGDWEQKKYRTNLNRLQLVELKSEWIKEWCKVNSLSSLWIVHFIYASCYFDCSGWKQFKRIPSGLQNASGRIRSHRISFHFSDCVIRFRFNDWNIQSKTITSYKPFEITSRYVATILVSFKRHLTTWIYI